MKPRIGIPLPTTADLQYNARSWPQYAAAVAAAGGDPLEIPLDSSAKVNALARQCAGFVLPGSPADVDPARYGQARESGTAAADAAREACDRLLLEHAAETGKPVLAICFGLQLLNVWRGGTLVQHLQPMPVNHSAGAQVAVAHSIRIARESLLAGLLTASEAPGEGHFRKLPVNSSHHQAIGIPGDDLAVTARASDDGVIEALEGRVGAAPMIGVQWHPERSTEISPTSRALFLWIVSAAEDLLLSEGAFDADAY